LKVLACPAGIEPATPCLEGRCSIQLSYGHIRLFCSIILWRNVPEIIGVIARADNPLMRGTKGIIPSLPLRIGDGLRLCLKGERHLVVGVSGGNPAHQRLRFPGRFGLAFKDPALGAAQAGLHGVFRRFVNAHVHG
jgi:hypothetical protein